GRTANGDRLLLVERSNLAGEEVRRVVERTEEVVLAKIAEPGGADRIAAALRDRVDHGAVHAAVFGVVAIGLDLEFFDVFLAVALVGAAAALVADVDAVHLILGHVLARGPGLDRARIAARARHQGDQSEPVAAIQRQGFDLTLLDA